MDLSHPPWTRHWHTVCTCNALYCCVRVMYTETLNRVCEKKKKQNSNWKTIVLSLRKSPIDAIPRVHPRATYCDPKRRRESDPTGSDDLDLRKTHIIRWARIMILTLWQWFSTGGHMNPAYKKISIKEKNKRIIIFFRIK